MADAEPPDGWLAPFLRDPTLWPVTAVALIVFSLFGATGLLLAFVERNGFALAAVALAFWVSVDAGVRERRRGGFPQVALSLALFWAVSGGGALLAWRLGWF
jgi:hypothetical protein